MKRLLSMLMNLVIWIFTIFFAISGVVFFPSLASVLFCLLAALLIPIKKIQNFWHEKFRKKWIKPILVILLFFGAAASIPEFADETTIEYPESVVEEPVDGESVELPIDDTLKETIVSDEEPIVEETWRNQFSEELVRDIEQAFEEIGENADNITYIEYVGVRETDLFDRRDYKVEFDRGEFKDALDEDKRPWRHNRWYLITTEEWHEGEPERDQYPREYLVTIKFWAEGVTTNINQWAHTGGGELQK